MRKSLMTEPVDLDIQAILERLPHRYPFLLVDRVLECRPGESIRALKNVTYNEPYFQGHFPARMLSPGRHSRDRKSTRLNSSHVSISYAVFCLKKKKKTNNHDTIKQN